MCCRKETHWFQTLKGVKAKDDKGLGREQLKRKRYKKAEYAVKLKGWRHFVDALCSS
jgi:hypothetical protein